MAGFSNFSFLKKKATDTRCPFPPEPIPLNELGVLVFALGVVVEGDEIDRLHQERHESAVNRSLADYLTGEGEEHQGAVNRQDASMVLLRDVLHQEDGRMLDLDNEHHRVFAVFIQHLGGNGNGDLAVVVVEFLIFQLQVEIHLGILISCQKHLGRIGALKGKILDEHLLHAENRDFLLVRGLVCHVDILVVYVNKNRRSRAGAGKPFSGRMVTGDGL